MHKNNLDRIIELADHLRKQLETLDFDKASSAVLKRLLDDMQELDDLAASVDHPIIKMIGTVIKGVGHEEVERAYEEAKIREAQNAPPSPQDSPSDLMERVYAYQEKIGALSQLTENDVSSDYVENLLNEGRRLKKEMDASANPLARIVGSSWEESVFKVLEKVHQEMAGQTPSSKGPSFSESQIKERMDGFIQLVERLDNKGDDLTSSDVLHAIEYARELKSMLTSVSPQVQANIARWAKLNTSDPTELFDFEGMEAHYHELVEEEKLRAPTTTAPRNTLSPKTAVKPPSEVSAPYSKQKVIDQLGVVQNVMQDLTTKGVKNLSATDIEKLLTSVALLKDGVKNGPQDIKDLVQSVLEMLSLDKWEERHAQLLKNAPAAPSEVAPTASSPKRVFVNGKFDVFEKGFIEQCQEYFEDIAVNVSKKSKKFLQEALQVMNGLPEDFKGLTAENSLEKEFISNLPGQTKLLIKIIERELKNKETLSVKKTAPKKATAKKTTTSEPVKKTSAKKRPTA